MGSGSIGIPCFIVLHRCDFYKLKEDTTAAKRLHFDLLKYLLIVVVWNQTYNIFEVPVLQ